MSILSALLYQEEIRNENMMIEYLRELEALPKGSIKTKKVKEKTYYYLAFRDGNRVITRYVGKDEQALLPIQEQLSRRKQVEEIIKKLKEEREQIKKMEAVL